MKSSYGPRIILIAVLVLVAAGLALIAVGRGCRAEPPPPATIAPTPTSTAVLITPQKPTGEPTIPQEPFLTPTATSTPEMATNTPEAEIEASATAAPSRTPVAPTPELLGTHRVRRGETMWGIGLQWYPRRWFLWAEHEWRPICEANPQIADCRMIFPGDVLRIPKR